MYTDSMQFSESHHSSPAAGAANHDFLTCGGCAQEFLLENITLFIAHKTYGCGHKADNSSMQDPGEDTSSPLTCSACSRVFMTARGLLHHVQKEHNMKICVKKGPLFISGQALRKPAGLFACPSSQERNSVESLRPLLPSGVSGSFSNGSISTHDSHVGEHARNKNSSETKDNRFGPTENGGHPSTPTLNGGPGNSRQEEPFVVDDDGKENNNDAADLTQTSEFSHPKAKYIRTASREHRNHRTSESRHQDPTMQGLDDVRDDGPNGRRSRSSSVPKKRWHSAMANEDEAGNKHHGTSRHVARSVCETDDLVERPGLERSSRYEKHMDVVAQFEDAAMEKNTPQNDTRNECTPPGPYDFYKDAPNEDIDNEEPMCLVIKSVKTSESGQQQINDARSYNSHAENEKNIKLKELLARHSPSKNDDRNAENKEYDRSNEMYNDGPPPSLIAMPSLEIPGDSHDRNNYQTQNYNRYDYADASKLATPNTHTKGQVSPISPHHSEQQVNLVNSFSPPGNSNSPQYINNSSMEQSIDQIIRHTMSREINDQEMWNRKNAGRSDPVDISQPSPVRPASNFDNSPTTSSYPRQKSPVAAYSAAQYSPMPSLIPSHQLSSSYYQRQPSKGILPPPLSPNVGWNSNNEYARAYNTTNAPSSPRTPSTTPGSARGSAIAANIPLGGTPHCGPPPPGPFVHDVPQPTIRRHLGYGSHGVGQRSLSESNPPGYGTNTSGGFYGMDVEFPHFNPLTGKGFDGAIASRLASDPGRDTPGSEFDDPKSPLDARMKKRRYPTSRPFKCSHCDQAFNQRIHLKKHMSKHTGVKPFKCQLCDYSTVERSHLKVHYRIHTGEKPYRCPYCDYATAQNSTLKIHLKRHHEDQQHRESRDGKTNSSGVDTAQGRRHKSNKITGHGNSRPSNKNGMVDFPEIRDHLDTRGSGQFSPFVAADSQSLRKPPMGRGHFGTSDSPTASTLPGGLVLKQELPDVDPDLAEQFHAYLREHVNDSISPDRDCQPGEKSHTTSTTSSDYNMPLHRRHSENGRTNGHVWPEMLEPKMDPENFRRVYHSEEDEKNTDVPTQANTTSLRNSPPGNSGCGFEKTRNAAPSSVPKFASVELRENSIQRHGGTSTPAGVQQLSKRTDEAEANTQKANLQEEKEKVKSEPQASKYVRQQNSVLLAGKDSSATDALRDAQGAVGGTKTDRHEEEMVFGDDNNGVNDEDDDDDDLAVDADLAFIVIPDKAFVRG